MNDRFKFRTFWKDEKRMYYFNSEFPKISKEDENIAVIMQCTGLKDKNGKLIYEGDIVKFLGVPCQIVFELGEFCIVRNCKFITVDEWYELLYADNWNDDTYSLAQLYFNTEGEGNFIDKVEVIGNIYENPELLEG